MVAAPKKKPKLTALSRRFTELAVWMGPADGTAPTKDDRSEYLQPMKIERVASGSRLNTAVLHYDLGKDQEHIQDTLTPKSINRQIEVREVDLFGETKRILYWGKLAAQPIEISSEKESVQYVLRMDKHHFGNPSGKVPFWNPAGSAVIELDRPLVFNPEIDEIIVANRSNKTWAARGSAFVFFDAAAIDTAAARTAHGQTPARWKIYEAVHALIWICNPNETFVKNPNLTECFVQLQEVDFDHDRLRNVNLEVSKYLPELLDTLLTPFGCSWTIDIEEQTTGEGEEAITETIRRFRFFERNKGTERELYLQRVGEDLDPVKSIVPTLSMNFDITTLSNKVIGCSSLRQREGTFELKKGWPVDQDGTTKEEFEENSGMAKVRPHAIRKWILGESGAWIGLRPEITEAYDLSDLFDGEPTLRTCRKFKPCLSRVTDPASSKLESRGLLVEWLDPDDSTWKKVKWSYSILELECGIYFETFPDRLWDALQDDPTTARVRITATIDGDTRLYATAVRDETSPNADDVTLRINLGDKFHDRAVHTSSVFYNDRATADQANDLLALQAYVETVRGFEDAADLSMSVRLEGIDHPEYQVGDLITKINGRNLALIRNNATLGVSDRYLQIMGITYEINEQSQSMELLLESFDEEQAL